MQTDHWTVIETNLKLLSGNISPGNRSYSNVLISKLANFRQWKALPKGDQKKYAAFKSIWSQNYFKTYMITLSELNHKLNHSHTIKIKNFLKQDDSDGRERKLQFLEKLSKPVFNKKNVRFYYRLCEWNNSINLTSQYHGKPTVKTVPHHKTTASKTAR